MSLENSILVWINIMQVCEGLWKCFCKVMHAQPGMSYHSPLHIWGQSMNLLLALYSLYLLSREFVLPVFETLWYNIFLNPKMLTVNLKGMRYIHLLHIFIFYIWWYIHNVKRVTSVSIASFTIDCTPYMHFILNSGLQN